MIPYLDYLNHLINKNSEEFGRYKNLKWLSPFEAESYEQKRNQLLSASLNWSFLATKPWINYLSKGCQICGSGKWLCLFIAGKCNASCFYCPAPQQQDDIPTAQQLQFNDAVGFREFVDFFAFSGVSFSGGEPLLAFNNVIHYLRELRKNGNPTLYIWLYTNGILASQEKLKKLAAEGLDEIRFDIGATGYNLTALKKATHLFPTLTVEIPAIPEEREKLKQLLPQLIDAGVTQLNLHQLRLTHYNAEKLIARGYTFLHGEAPVALESELTALEIMQFAVEKHLPIGVNYCNLQYKRRFQKAGYRKTIATKFADPLEKVTKQGFLRSLYVSEEEIQYLETLNHPQLSRVTTEQFLSCFSRYKTVIVRYRGILLHEDYGEYLQTVPFNTGSKTLQCTPANAIIPIELHGEQIQKFVQLITSENDAMAPPDNETLFLIWQHEFIEKGLRPYY
ncbi:MAG: 4Fe-4S cluster-binding domain-containing protein [Bacteroidales bacterium]|nr:4Fe-4S cluster-binding domain-containing protein [Bacteroidales bacterium]MDY0285110.1 4Fe-4S cluster-binding domain-containing protein [Bacteroidales bacterium]